MKGPEEPFSFAFFSCGGMGARGRQDGLSATSFPSGIQNVATEVIESSSPVVFHQRELRPDSGGAGRHRGGLGQVIRFEVRSQGPWTLSAMYDRIKFPPRGTQGGRDGQGGAVHDENGRALPSKGRVSLAAQSQVLLELPGGGGFGDPRERLTAAVDEDVAQGYVTMDGALRDYGRAGAG
jgi:N-methylhydantoinase B/oxoprolinase/acetone carboxylase alpha subunit